MLCICSCTNNQFNYIEVQQLGYLFTACSVAYLGSNFQDGWTKGVHQLFLEGMFLQPQMGTYFFKILNGGTRGGGGTDLGWVARTLPPPPPYLPPLHVDGFWWIWDGFLLKCLGGYNHQTNLWNFRNITGADACEKLANKSNMLFHFI